MKERSKVIFGNEISAKAYRKAIRNKQNYVRKYGDDSAAEEDSPEPSGRFPEKNKSAPLSIRYPIAANVLMTLRG